MSKTDTGKPHISRGILMFDICKLALILCLHYGEFRKYETTFSFCCLTGSLTTGTSPIVLFLLMTPNWQPDILKFS